MMPAMSSTDLQTWTPRPAYSPNPYNGDPFFNDSFPIPPAWTLGGTSRTARPSGRPGVVYLGGGWVAYTSWEVAPGRRCISVARAAVARRARSSTTAPGPFVCDTDPGGSIDAAAVRRHQRPALPPVEVLRGPRLGTHQDQGPGPQRRRALVRARLLARGHPADRAAVGRQQHREPVDGQATAAPTGSSTRATSGSRPTTGWARPPAPARSGRASRTSGSPLIENTATEWSPGGGTLFTDTTGRLRIIYQVWNAPYTSYPTNPNCDGPGLCAEPGPALLPHRRAGRRPAGTSPSTRSASLDQASLQRRRHQHLRVGPRPVDPGADPRSTSTSTVSPCRSPPTGRAPTSAPPSRASARPTASRPSSAPVPAPTRCAPTASAWARPATPCLGCRTVVVPDSAPFGNLDGGHDGAAARSRSAGGRSTPTPPRRSRCTSTSTASVTARHRRRRPPRRGCRLPGRARPTASPPRSRPRPGPTGLRLRHQRRRRRQHAASAAAPWSSPAATRSVSLDTATGVRGGVAVGGWAIDPDTVRRRSRCTSTSTGSGSPPRLDSPAADVGAVFPLYGPGHGFTATVPAARRAPHASAPTASTWRPARSTRCSAAARSSCPTPRRSAPSTSVMPPSGGRVSSEGWAIDPDIVRVDRRCTSTSTACGTALTRRPDRARRGCRLPGLGPAHGFARHRLGAPPVPAHGVRLRPSTSAPAPTRLLGCRTVVVG